jgi:hypothetical protein
MVTQSLRCPDCERGDAFFTRRDFLKAAGAGATAALAAGPLVVRTLAGEPGSPGPVAAEMMKTPENAVKRLFDSFSENQKRAVCFDWDYVDSQRGLLRTRVAANWRITEPRIKSGFFTPEQQHLIREIYEGIIRPDWHVRFDKQLADDDGGFGTNQRIAIFGRPGAGRFEFVLTGRHMTIRCDGNSAEHVAFGGPIFYGHAASGFTEKPAHPGNIFWHQALAANRLYTMLDGKQQKQALLPTAPQESAVGFRESAGRFPGIPATELSGDQRRLLQDVLQKLIEPYRQSDGDEVVACLKAQGGLDRCCLAFYKEPDLGGDGVWDVWRLEGPAFVWHFRGAPHVHTWVNVADNPSVKLNV